MKNKAQKETMHKFSKTDAMPSLVYGRQALATMKGIKSSIKVPEMKFLIRVKECNHQGRIQIENILKTLQTFNLNKYI